MNEIFSQFNIMNFFSDSVKIEPKLSLYRLNLYNNIIIIINDDDIKDECTVKKSKRQKKNS